MDEVDGQVSKQLLANGLINVVTADAAQAIVACHGRAAAEFPVGAPLSLVVPPLVGLSDAIAALRDQPAGARVIMANVAMMAAVGAAERRDYVVTYDSTTDGFILLITPAFAFDAVSIEMEQHERREQQLRNQLAAQAQAIQDANAALRRTNKDLINFTRIISHDLKAPMRAIRYSAEDLGETLAESTNETQIEAVAELRQHAVRLSRMVTDLLTYSRLEDKSVAAAPVDTHALINTIAGSLPRPPELALSISGQWPEIVTIGVLLDVVLRNLLDNAIKHHDTGDGLITIDAGKTDVELLIWVSDDGPGIPKEYQQAVLRPFIKVKSDHSDSSGMGLSMVHKVITDVGGRLIVGNRPDGRRGTVMQVAWPLTIMAN